MAVNYLNNRDILSELHKSKNSYCTFLSPEYHQYDIILPSVEKINIRTIAAAKRNKAKRLSDENRRIDKLANIISPKSEYEIDYRTISKQELIFRIMTYDHIPVNLTRKKTKKNIADGHEKVNFPPFQHWKFNEQNELMCVGKSHWSGDLETGHFDISKGRMTENLARMIIKLCERNSTRGRFRMYSYNDEMIDQAIFQLTQIALQFDESQTDNPFAYYTKAITNSFWRVLNIERKAQSMRDDILEINGLAPSHTRIIDAEYAMELKKFDDEQSQNE